MKLHNKDRKANTIIEKKTDQRAPIKLNVNSKHNDIFYFSINEFSKNQINLKLFLAYRNRIFRYFT